MKECSYIGPLVDIEEIGDRVMQLGSHLDKKQVELRQSFPPSQTPTTTTYSSLHMGLAVVTTCSGKIHPPGCALRAQLA